MRTVPWISDRKREREFDFRVSIGLANEECLEPLTFTTRVTSASEIKNHDIGSSSSVLIVDFRCLERGSQSDGLNNDYSKENIYEKAFDYVRAVSELCRRCRSVTLIRTVHRSVDGQLYKELYESLCTGALRSLQSEQTNLQIAELSLEGDMISNTELQTILQRICYSETFPSDLFLGQGNRILARSTYSLRNGFERYRRSEQSDQWRSIYVFGGASAITLECLLHVADSSSEIHLFGRRIYDHIEDKVENALKISNVQQYIIENEPEYAKDLTTLRSRIKFLESQIELSVAMKKLRSLGASVHYHKCDITDIHEIKDALLEIKRTGGLRATAVLFAAGTLRDNLMCNMDIVEFVDVAAVKCKGLENVLNECPLEECQSLYVFGSVSGTYGNKGQANYSAGNEALFRQAQIYSAQKMHMKTVVFNWGPWGEVGMAEPEVNAQFASRGISPLSTMQGVSCFLYAANIKCSGFYSPVCGYAPWNDLELTFNTGLAPNLESVYTLRDKSIRSSSALSHFMMESTNGNDQISILLYLEKHPLFTDHILGSNYVLPFAFFVEIFLASFIRLYPSEIPALNDIRCLRGIQLPLTTSKVSLTVRYEEEQNTKSRKALVFVDGSDIPSYTAVFDRRTNIPSHVGGRTITSRTLPTNKLPDISSLYKDYLFHGPAYQVIDRLVSVDLESINARVCLSGMPSDLGLWADSHWICPPPLFDSVAQLALVWRRLYDDKSALPSSASNVVVIKAERLSGILDVALSNIVCTDYDMTFDVSVVDMHGEDVLYAKRMICACSAALNRLNTEWVHSMEQRGLIEI